MTQPGQQPYNYFDDNTIPIAPGQTQTLALDAMTQDQYCQFTFNLLVDTPSGQVTETVSDHGKPFTISGVTEHNGIPSFASYEEVYVGGLARLGTNHSLAQVNPKTYR